MAWFCLSLAGVAWLLSTSVCVVMLRRAGGGRGVDRAGAEPHKNHGRDVPNTGGVGIAASVLGPMIVVLGLAGVGGQASWAWLGEGVAAHLPGLRSVLLKGWVLVGALAVVHGIGRVDDARPLPAWIKLLAQLGASVALAVLADMRVLQLLDDAVPGGYAISLLVSVLWIVALTNALNMLDNMDGLSAGVAAICASIFLGAAWIAGQWFVVGASALLLGGLLGFLQFNFPPARIFMGDSGSLMIGMLLAVIAIRTTYIPPGTGLSAERWHALLTPLVVLAIPLYDFCSVVLIRLRQGRRPWIGDNQHFSHRLVLLGLSRPRAVGVIYLATAATGLGGLVLGRVGPWQAGVIALASLAVVAMIAVLEHGTARSRSEQQ